MKELQSSKLLKINSLKRYVLIYLIGCYLILELTKIVEQMKF